MDEQVPSSPAGVVSPERRQMSIIFRPIAAWPNMMVEEKIAFGLKIGLDRWSYVVIQIRD
jgi:iron(III) transport system ATP-binding protein